MESHMGGLRRAVFSFAAKGKIPVFSAVLFQQMDVLHDHPFIYGLAHVVNGEKRDIHSSQSFHLHSRLAGTLDGADGFHTWKLWKQAE